MRKTEQLKIAWAALLAESEKSPVTIYYRGMNDADEKLYEFSNRRATLFIELGTEKEVLESLMKGGLNDNM